MQYTKGAFSIPLEWETFFNTDTCQRCTAKKEYSEVTVFGENAFPYGGYTTFDGTAAQKGVSTDWQLNSDLVMGSSDFN